MSLIAQILTEFVCIMENFIETNWNRGEIKLVSSPKTFDYFVWDDQMMMINIAEKFQENSKHKI